MKKQRAQPKAQQRTRIKSISSKKKAVNKHAKTTLPAAETTAHTPVGEFSAIENGGWIIPDDRKSRGIRVYIPASKTKGAVDGNKVIYRVTGLSGDIPKGEILGILGHKNDPGVDVLSIVTAYGMTHSFPKQVLDEAAALPDAISDADLAGRRDLRGQLCITIDGADAKDLDDAVSLETTDKGYRLYVHIADVTHYVRPGTALDKEAFRRGTSVYLADRVIPMLPHKLSNGICSLNAGEDRLALSCVIDINEKGWVTDSGIYETVIRVHDRMTYDDVSAIISSNDGFLRESYAHIVPMLEDMANLAEVLRCGRLRRGALELTSNECRFKLDETGFPTNVSRFMPDIASSIIEEFMILCNETVARVFFARGLPFIYRTHEDPDPEKMERLADFARRLGFKISAVRVKNGKKPPVYTSKTVQSLLNAVEGTPFQHVINRVALMSMQQARYTADNTGHYGLSSTCYCHFTAPIRRYPDLWDHRAIKLVLQGTPSKAGDRKGARLGEICRSLSAAERLAIEAEREVENLKKIQYMTGQLGKEFDGVISGVKGWGLYVELENTVEGLVSLRSMDDDYYVVDEESWLVYGERSKKQYRLGDSVRIKVVSANTELRRLDFELV